MNTKCNCLNLLKTWIQPAWACVSTRRTCCMVIVCSTVHYTCACVESKSTFMLGGAGIVVFSQLFSISARVNGKIYSVALGTNADRSLLVQYAYKCCSTLCLAEACLDFSIVKHLHGQQSTCTYSYGEHLSDVWREDTCTPVCLV
jgi:hypothetical protein